MKILNDLRKAGIETDRIIKHLKSIKSIQRKVQFLSDLYYKKKAIIEYETKCNQTKSETLFNTNHVLQNLELYELVYLKSVIEINIKVNIEDIALQKAFLNDLSKVELIKSHANRRKLIRNKKAKQTKMVKNSKNNFRKPYARIISVPM